MTDYTRRSIGYSGSAYDRWVERQSESSPLTKVQQQYWSTKHAVYRKLGKKEDDCIVSSDAELDAKLELFKNIAETCGNLQRIIEKYQDRICNLSQEENAMGRFLKEHGKLDKTRAGKMMTATGKTMSYSAQQRLALRVPLVRLYQEVETFHQRAIDDTNQTVLHMEKMRTDYRGALMWMKNVSQELDPDTHKQLEKFRKVQLHVRTTKSKFDKLKLDCLQKIDLLAASRCNMFSHALILYQNTLLNFWEKTSRTMTSVTNSFKGYQHYEFSVVKELAEPSKKLAERTTVHKEQEDGTDKDKLLFFDAEYQDEKSSEKKEKVYKNSGPLEKRALGESKKSDSLENLFNLDQGKEEKTDVLLDLDIDDDAFHSSDLLEKNSNPNLAVPSGASGTVDLLTDTLDFGDTDKDDLALLNEILNTAPSTAAEGSFTAEWEAKFGHSSDSATNDSTLLKEIDDGLLFDSQVSSTPSTDSGPLMQPASPAGFLPSQLLGMSRLSLQQNVADYSHVQEHTTSSAVSLPTAPISSKPAAENKSAKKDTTKDMSAWFNLFADLDPLTNPDAVGKTGQTEDDRTC